MLELKRKDKHIDSIYRWYHQLYLIAMGLLLGSCISACNAIRDFHKEYGWFNPLAFVTMGLSLFALGVSVYIYTYKYKEIQHLKQKIQRAREQDHSLQATTQPFISQAESNTATVLEFKVRPNKLRTSWNILMMSILVFVILFFMLFVKDSVEKLAFSDGFGDFFVYLYLIAIFTLLIVLFLSALFLNRALQHTITLRIDKDGIKKTGAVPATTITWEQANLFTTWLSPDDDVRFYELQSIDQVITWVQPQPRKHKLPPTRYIHQTPKDSSTFNQHMSLALALIAERTGLTLYDLDKPATMSYSATATALGS